jgi:hypothetical protein
MERFGSFFAPSGSPRVIEHRHLLPVTDRSTAWIMVCLYQWRENDQKGQSNISLSEMAEGLRVDIYAAALAGRAGIAQVVGCCARRTLGWVWILASRTMRFSRTIVR